MIANDPSLTNRQVMNIIKSTARDVGTPRYPTSSPAMV